MHTDIAGRETQAKRSRPGGRTARVKEAILNAVSSLKREDGEQEFSLSAIAAKAGVSLSTISRRWDELVDDIEEIRHRGLLDAVDVNAAPDDFRSLEGWVRTLSDHLFEVAAALRMRAGGAMPLSVLERFDALVRATLSDFTAKSGMSAELLVEVMVAPVVYRYLSGGPRFSDEELRCAARRLASAHRPKSAAQRVQHMLTHQ